MAELNANIVVEPITLTVTDTTQSLDVTVDSTNLNIYTSTGVSRPAGNVGELQYHAGGNIFGAIANSNVDAGGNLVFTNLSNVKINGGNNAYYLQTDGTGNLTWAAGATPTGNGVPSGANTQIQLSDGSGGFDSGVGFTFDNVSNVLDVPGNVVSTGLFIGDAGGLSNIVGGNVVGVVPSASLALFATTANAVAGANVSGEVAFAAIANAVAGANVSGEVGFANVANNVAAANVSGQVANALVAGTVYTATQPNITSVGTLTSLTVSGSTIVEDITLNSTGSVQEIIEKVTANATGATGIIDFDLLDGALRLQTANATANFGLNFRGDGSTTLGSVLSTNESMTCTFINKNGATAYIPTSVYIDSVTYTPLWSGVGGPGSGTPNGSDMYTFNIIKTSAAPTYQIYASRIGYI